MVQAARNGSGGRRKSISTDVILGGLYQIAHTYLPRESPFWLKSIQVVKVSFKNVYEVTVDFPSKQSLDYHLPRREYPRLDMSFTIKMKLVPKIFVQQVIHPELDNLERLKAFWMVNTLSDQNLELEKVSTRYLSSSAIGSEVEEVDDEIDEKNALSLVVKEESVDEQHVAVAVANNGNLKRKFKHWSVESFTNGEEAIMGILKDMNAVYANEILRPALRKEAQKKIGNTGLLDHLLKYIPGKVTPDGSSRFQRCHNYQGEMIYWLENTELADIRKKAGVEDPSWIPSSCWKQNGCNGRCPCAKELNALKEELSNLKRELEETKRQKIEVGNAEQQV